MPTFNLCLIGSGIISGAHASGAAESPYLRVTAVADPDLARAQALASQTGAEAFDSFASVLSSPLREDLDGVVVCTPPSVRLELVEQALTAGLPVLIEKPLAHTIDDAECLVELGRAHPDIPARVAYCHRFTPATVRMKRMAEAGEIGALVRFENVFACWHPAMKDKWMSDPAVSGGGSLIDTGSHGLDLFHYLVGPSERQTVVERFGWDDRGESNATLLVRSDPDSVTDPNRRSVAGVLMCGWTEPERFTVTLVGTAGLLHYDFADPTTLRYQPSQGNPERIEVESHDVRFRRQLEAFARVARHPDQPSELATLRQGLAVTRGIQPDPTADREHVSV